MNTVKTWQTESINSDQTEQLGELLGANLRGGEVIELVSDLGGGKTTMTRGIVRGTGSVDRVASPTFTVSKTYDCPAFTIVHFDFYRLPEAGLVAEELREYVNDPEFVVIVEWADIVQHVLPENRLTIRINQTAEDTRMLELSYPESLAYLLKGVTDDNS